MWPPVSRSTGGAHVAACDQRLWHNPSVTDRPPRPRRAEPRDVVELKQLKAAQPELASAVDMQIALVDMQRRVQGGGAPAWVSVGSRWPRAPQAARRPPRRLRRAPPRSKGFRPTFPPRPGILPRC